jgi:hypothetical protein
MILEPRGKPRVQEILFRYLYAGMSVAQEPIPWSADQVEIEARLQTIRLPSDNKSAFCLHLSDGSQVAPAELEIEPDKSARLCFRIPVPRRTGEVCVEWRGSKLAELTLPVLSAEEFLSKLHLETAAVLARLRQDLVACQVSVATELRGIQACGLLVSPTSLLPLLDLGVTVQFMGRHSGQVDKVAVTLPREDCIGHRALASAVPPSSLTLDEPWLIRWLVADRCLGERPFRVTSREDFVRTVYLVDARYACQGMTGTTGYHNYLPARGSLRCVGPCFRLASREPGAAGFCPVQLRTLFKDSERPPQVHAQEILVSDGPSSFLPPLLSAQEFEQVNSFELVCAGQIVATLPGCRPVLRFTSEGGFTEFTDFDWTPVAEEELNDRLKKLTELPDPEALPRPFSAA